MGIECSISHEVVQINDQFIRQCGVVGFEASEGFNERHLDVIAAAVVMCAVSLVANAAPVFENNCQQARCAALAR